MKYLILVGFLISPVVLLNFFVMPELIKLQDFYSNIDTYSQQAVYGPQPSKSASR